MKVKVEFIYKVIPVPILENKKLDRGGKSLGVLIILRDIEKSSESLIQHELVHAKQFYRTLGLHGILYSFYEKYRYNSEIEAYRKSIEVAKLSWGEALWIPESIRKDKKIKYRSDYQIMKDLFN